MTKKFSRALPNDSIMSHSEILESGSPGNEVQNDCSSIPQAPDELFVTGGGQIESEVHDDYDSAVLHETISEVSKIDLKTNALDKRQKLLEKFASEEFNDIPILRHETTIDWIGKNYVIVVMRGLPGSGKSTLVNIFQNNADTV